jgi:hypothetical protein
MLRIDESSKTLVAPEASELVPDEALTRDELHALITAGWEAFAAEIGLPRIKAVGPIAEADVDLLAMDVDAGRITVVIVGEGAGKSSTGRALSAAAHIASWDADKLGATHELLQGATPGDSPRMLIVGPKFDDDATHLADYLCQHDMSITAYHVEVMRKGGDRLMTVKQSYPALPPAPDIVATVDSKKKSKNSAPPPPPPAEPVEAA